MRYKMFKKILAAMIVASAIITTPETVSAGPNKFLGRKTKRPKNVEKETKDEKSEIAKLNPFLNQENIDCDSKRKFAQMVENLASGGFLKNLAKEKMLEITCEGCKSINISDYIYDFVAPHRLILENISDTWIEGANYYVHDNESDIKIYCLDVKFKIV